MSTQYAHTIVYEVALKTGLADEGNGEILRRILVGLGIDEYNVVETQEWPYVFLRIYFPDLNQARSVCNKVRAFRLKHVRVLCKKLRPKDWQTKWKTEFRPFALTDHFGVIPLWLRDKRRVRGRMPIYIDSHLAFGTGMHATTRLMAGFLDRYRGKYKSVLDVGTGTGILAMVAAKCGAEAVTAIDNDPMAVETARKNCRANECALIDVKAVDAAQWLPRRQYDYVCANLITQDLIRMAGQLIRLVRPGKFLAVSGISSSSYDFFRKAYARYPLRCLKLEKSDGWVAILFQRQL